MRIQLCGRPIVEDRGVRMEDHLPGRQGRLLFAYLVLNRDRPATRPELVQAVWPAPSSADAASGLAPLISKLRKLFGAYAIEGHSAVRLKLRPDAVVDVEDAASAVHRAESRIAQSDWHHAWAPSLAALFIAEREFLPGDEAPWIDDERRELASIRLRALEAYAAATGGMGGTELPAAVRSARRLVQLEPLRERGYQLLMRALDAEGDPAGALGVYAELRTLLRDELGVSPSPASQAVYDDIIRR